MVSHWGAIAAVVVGTIITIVGIVLGWYVFPNLVEDQIAENVILNKGTDQFERFEELPIPLDFKVYVFNVDNPDKVNSGEEKPRVTEKGPYIYRQSRMKQNITWEKNEISYYEYLNFEYVYTTESLTEDDPITVINPALNGAIQILELTGLTFLLPLLDNTADLSFGARDIFLKTTVREFLFEGYNICQVDKIRNMPDTEVDKKKKVDAIIACLGLFVMPTKNIRPNINGAGEKELVFTFLAHKNGTHDGHYTIDAGTKDVHDVGSIRKWEDKDYLPYWGDNNSTCNEVKGRDAVIYEPFLTDKSVLTVFNTDICRTVELHYTNDKEVRDVTALEYQLGEDAFQQSCEDGANEMCYCLNVTRGITQENGCTKNGMLELFTCYNAPILLSYPHLLWADEEYVKAVDGLKPDISKHKTFTVLEPNTGTPLAGAKRVQFNMFVRDVVDGEGVSLVKFLEGYKGKDTLVPILWLEEGFEITDKLYNDLYDSYISKTYLIEGVTWGVIGVGLAVIVITIIVYAVLKKREKNQTV